MISERDTMLYDLEKDMEETTDLSHENSGLVKDLTAQLKDWEKEVAQGIVMKTK